MQPSSHNPISNHEQQALQFERVVFFSDAVFAIAITLLVIEIKVPVMGNHAHGDMFPSIEEVRREGPPALFHLIPKILGFFVSFLVIGQYWINHHRNFGHIRRYDSGLLWRNLILLMAVAFIPFTTGLYYEYFYWNVALILYAANVLCAGLAQLWVWRYATKNHRLTDATLSPHLIDKISLGHFGVLITFSTALVAGYFNILWVMGAVWIFIPMTIRYAERRYQKRIANEQLAVEEPV